MSEFGEALVGKKNVEAKMVSGVSLVAPGKYLANVVGVAIENTYNNDGRQLVVDFETANEGCPVREWFVFKSTGTFKNGGSVEAAGLSKLRCLVDACGIAWPLTSETQLMGLPLMLQLVQKESNKMKDDGTPFINMNITKFGVAEKTTAPATPATPETGHVPF